MGNGDRRRETRPDALDHLGSRLRDARLKREIGLRELARRTNVSPSLISQIETGKSEPSLSTLYTLVTELDLSLNEVVFEGDGHVAAGAHDGSEVVVRRDDRNVIHLESGVTWERLTARSDHDVDFLHVIYHVGGSSTVGDALIRHAGNEYGFVLSGRLRVTLGFDEIDLGPGDSISFASTTPHRLMTLGDEPAHAIWLVVGRHPDTDERAAALAST